MAVAYFDCFSGVAGDMVLGALVDAGLPLKKLERELAKLPIGDYRLVRARGKRDIRGTNLRVEVSRDLRPDDYTALDRLVAKSRLAPEVREMARAILKRLAEAEARVHRVPVAKVHFHEVGAIDSIVDIVGSAIGFAHFGFTAIHASPLPMTRGRVRCAHGTFPVPAPATMELLAGVPLEPAPVQEEIVTPTGAAILTTVAAHFGDCPLQRVDRIGYGFGDKRLPMIPNALRLMIGEGFPVMVVQANIDDMNPELFDYAIEKLFAAGAVDVDLAAVQMKHNRPGIKLSALSPWERKDEVIETMLRETSTFGVRYWPVERRVLTRELKKERVKKGTIAFKIGRDADGTIVKVAPEYRDVKKCAKQSRRPIGEVYREALAVAARLQKR